MARRRWGYWESYFPPRSKPRAVKGGIKSQAQRGQFGKSWWAQRWIRVLESFDIGARLSRGRSYARSGQVLSIAIEKGKATAKVQGSRPKPYDVTIKVKTFTAADTKKLGAALARQALFAAKLLAGEMPQDIETAFADTGLSLFPEKLRDLTTDCSCPDWSNPCKHVAAVYYLLGEEFDRDPFLIFKLRGLTLAELTKLLGASGKSRTVRAPAAAPEVTELALPAEPLPAEPAAYWSSRALPDDFLGEVVIPPDPAALPRRLGSFPFWRGEEPFLPALERIYRHAAPLGLSCFLGERTP